MDSVVLHQLNNLEELKAIRPRMGCKKKTDT